MIFFSVFYLTSCNNGNKEQQGSATTMKEPGKTTPGRQPQMDPVCEMPRSSEWTDHTIYNNDTVWFCSEGCKMAFNARPAKYIKQTQR